MSKRRRATLPWMAAWEAQAAMWTVLGIRVPQLLSGTMTAAEQTRMVAEKVQAAAESQAAAAQALGRAMMKPARTPQDVAAAFGSVAQAALRPYHRKVTGNAKRLKTSRKRPAG